MSGKIVQQNEEVIKGELKEGVSKRRVKGSQRGKKGQQPLDDENNSGLSAIRNGCRPEQKQQELPGDFPVFWESICFAVPA